jgi:hypothetical protein
MFCTPVFVPSAKYVNQIFASQRRNAALKNIIFA